MCCLKTYLVFQKYFVEQNKIFDLKPMTFIDPKTNTTMKVWRDYYKDLETDIPEGELGINPGIMSLSNKIDIVHEYGLPSNSAKE